MKIICCIQIKFEWDCLEGVWQCGSGCFSNNFVLKYMPMIFFKKKKLFLTSAHQNDPKRTNHIKF